MTIFLILLMSYFVSIGNFIFAIATFLIAIIIMILLKRKVKGILNDERVYKIGGKASRMVLVVFAFIMAFAGIIFVSLKNTYPEYFLLGNILLLLECAMMLLYAILFKYYSKKEI